MRRLCLILFITVMLVPVCAQVKYIPHEGDLLFQAAGTSSFSGAIADATAWSDSIKFVHVAIVAVESGKPYIIEATAADGVVITPWDDFLRSSPLVDGCPGVVVMRVNKDFPVADAVNRARSHLGESYDWSYRPANGKMYCSELVYDSYLNYDGTPLFTARPMNFRDADGNMPAFWTELFSRLNEPVPEGVPGTNPNDMSKEPVLVEVHRYF